MSGKAHSSLYKDNGFIGKYCYKTPKKFNVSKLIGIWYGFYRKRAASCSAGSVRQNSREY